MCWNVSNKSFPNEEYQKLLDDLIPGGAHTYSKGRDVFPANAPALLKRGKGSKVWDIYGNKYLDYGMGLKSVVLGYSHKGVNASARKAYALGNNLSRPSLTELNAAELLIEVIEAAEMVKFAKNGSNVTTAAVKLARAYTGRKIICVPEEQPFFSFDDWFIGGTLANAGVPEEHYVLTRKFSYGNIDSISSLFADHGSEIAAVMLEPAVSFLPCDCLPSCLDGDCPESVSIEKTKNYLQELKRICERHGAILIFDEMRTGFRWNLQGAQRIFETTPHLSTFGKAMANGYSLAALVGLKDIMSIASTMTKGTPRTFLLSSTHGAEMGPLAAFIKVVEVFRRENVSAYLWEYGKKLKDSVKLLLEKHNLNDFIHITGPSIAPLLDFSRNPSVDHLSLSTLFYELLSEQKVLMPSISHSYAHSERDLVFTLNAFDETLRAVSSFDMENLLPKYNHKLGPVFRKTN